MTKAGRKIIADVDKLQLLCLDTHEIVVPFDEEREREEKKHHLYQLKQQLEQYLQELPVVGFNTGKYDVNAMKVDFFNIIPYLGTSKRKAFSLISVKCCKQDSTVSLVSPSVTKQMGSV
jgi:hypothetical protein